jgi:DNA/RNA endonuclease YhcR with UshA esterase domain
MLVRPLTDNSRRLLEKGKSLDPDKFLDAIKKTTFHSTLSYLEVKAVGEVVIGEKETLLKVNGGTQQFVLGPDPDKKPKEGETTPFQRLKEAASKAGKVVSVTGRVQGWGGDFRKGKKAEDAKEAAPDDRKGPHLLIVTEFEIAKRPK